MAMQLFRWLAMLAPLAALCGCAYASFNRDSFDVKIRTVTLDPRLPQLKAYQECVVECAGCSSICTGSVPAEYTFAHFDEASSEPSPIISASVYGTDRRSFSGFAKLIPSYSFNPDARVLDTVAEDNYSSGYHQHIAFYRNVGAHRAMPGLRVFDVLGNVSGIPAELATHAYRVYEVDFAKVTKRSVTADRLTEPLCTATSCSGPAGKVTILQLDPVPDISMKTQAQQFNCRVRTSSTDWHIYSGMAATSRGDISYSRRCQPQ